MKTDHCSGCGQVLTSYIVISLFDNIVLQQDNSMLNRKAAILGKAIWRVILMSKNYTGRWVARVSGSI